MTKDVYFHGPRPPTDKFPNAVRHGNLVFTSGHVAVDEEGNVIAPGDVVAQANAVFSRLGELLEFADSSLADVIKITAFLTEVEDYPSYNEVRHKWFSDSPPASSSVVVAKLVRTGLVVEIEAVAQVRE